MKLKDYIKKLTDIAEANPKALEYDVVYSTDDEGNAFNEVYCGPTTGYFDGCEFYNQDSDQDDNAICLN